MISLRPIDSSNYGEAIELSVATDQQRFVASNLQSLADAYVWREAAEPYAVYSDDEMVGFALLCLRTSGRWSSTAGMGLPRPARSTAARSSWNARSRLGRSVMALRIPRVVLRVGPGPTWTSGLPENQPGWDEHAAFINAQIDRGLFLMGGTWAGRLGSMSIWEGVNAHEVREVMQQDPFIQNGVFVIEDVADWIVYVDTRIE